MIKRNTNVKDQQTFRRRLILVMGILICGGLACWGLFVAFVALRGIWLEQFRIRSKDDEAIAVVVTSSGKNVHPDTIKLYFGLTNGANLATIPYEELRTRAISKYPAIDDIKIERRLPLRVTVTVEERKPAVRIVPPKGKPESGLVADFDGVVFRTFNCPPLPVIREANESHCKPGARLEGHARAALQRVQLLSEDDGAKSGAASELSNLRVREVDTSKTDYVLATLDD